VTTASAAPAPHHCPRCARRYVVVSGRSIASPPLCACGETLVATSLPSGVYELRRSRRASRRRHRNGVRPPEPLEPDQGYGESHGYGPAHGGPTGPGDAPASERADDAA